jgi:hypothetical protein
MNRDEAERLLYAFQAAAIDAYTQHDGPSELDTKREQARAAVIAAMTRATPPGWKLVPETPTEEMEAAGWIDKEDVCPCDIYAAMLAAAPEAPKEGIT